MLLYAQCLCPANQAEPRAAKFLRHCVPAAQASVKIANAPSAAQPTIVLPDFARSLSAEGKRKHQKKHQKYQLVGKELIYFH
jgi:hypothetical protein